MASARDNARRNHQIRRQHLMRFGCWPDPFELAESAFFERQLELITPVMFESLAPMKLIPHTVDHPPMEVRYGSTIARFPLSLRYLDGI